MSLSVHSLGEYYLYAEMLSVYSKAPSDWAKSIFYLKLYFIDISEDYNSIIRTHLSPTFIYIYIYIYIYI